MKSLNQRICLLLGLSFSIQCSIKNGVQQAMENQKPGQVQEIIEGHAIVPLPVSGFEKLSKKDKLLAYHLYRAAVAGRDITFDQLHRDHLAIKRLCEEILLYSSGIDSETLKDVEAYLKLQYLNIGIYGKFTYAKFLPPKRFTPQKLREAAMTASKNGASFGNEAAISDMQHLAMLERIIFDPTSEPFSTTRSPGAGQDILTASANNYYDRGIRLGHLEGFTERYPLNSRIAFEEGKLVEEVWRVGDVKRKIPPGRYAQPLTRVVKHLEDALIFAEESNAKALRFLIDYYKAGDPKIFAEYNVAWLAYGKPTVDTINGFIEEYHDPRGKKGSWEGLVFFVNPVTSGWINQVASMADDYERKTPFHDEYKRKGVKPIANMVEVLVETGDAGPISWSGINLPNDQSIRQKYGSKNVLLWNARTARDEVSAQKLIREFVAGEDQENILKHRKIIPEILVGFHEVLGHASGKKSEKMKGDPSEHLGEYYSWLEEERADLLALHHAWNPETFRIRKDWSEEAARALYKYYPVMEMMGLAEVPEGSHALEEPHAVGGHFAINYFKKKWKVIDEISRDTGGRKKTYWVVRDENVPRMREAVAELLKELQRIKSEGDLRAIKRLSLDYGATKFDPQLAKEIRQRKQNLGIPSYFGFIFPELKLIEKDGEPQDVKITYPQSFLRQQMKWSGYSEEQLKNLPSWM